MNDTELQKLFDTVTAHRKELYDKFNLITIRKNDAVEWDNNKKIITIEQMDGEIMIFDFYNY